VKTETAARLSRRAGRRREDGSRGLLARRARDRLVRAGNAGDRNAIEAAWQAWLRCLDDDLFQTLESWRGPFTVARAALAAAMHPDRGAAERAAIGAFCASRGLAPDDPIRRAVFYVLTGQHPQHRAADPDGSLLGAGYRGSDLATRAVLRAELAGAGGLDLVRIVGGQRDRGAPLSAEESDYLTAQLADRRDWSGLWRLVRDLPLARAVAAARQFDDGWRPADERGRALFARLANADPRAVSTARDALAAPVVVNIEMDHVPTGGSFSPDGRRLLIATARGGRYSGCRILELPGGAPVERHDYNGKHAPPAVLHLGSAFFVVGMRGFTVWELVRYAAGQPEVTDWHHAPIFIAAHPSGFVLQKRDQPVQLRDPRGEVTRKITVTPVPRQPRLVAADPGSGRLAMTGYPLLRIVDSDTRTVLASTVIRPDRIIASACFLGPDRVALFSLEEALLYRLAGPELNPVGLERAAKGWGRPVPLRAELAVLDGDRVRYLRADTLADVAEPREFAGRRGTALWGSADGRSHALGGSREGRGFVDVAWGGETAVTALADRPMGSMTLRDLAAATAAAAELAPSPAAWPFLQLLRQCLRHRFAMDVGVGSAVTLTARETDVALSEEGESAC
jgi:hypothetical protein